MNTTIETQSQQGADAAGALSWSKERVGLNTELLVDQLVRLNIRHERSVNLADFTYLKTGGHASVVIFPENEEELAGVVKCIHENGVPYKVIGNTSNLLFLDNTEYRCLISTTAMKGIYFDEVQHEIAAECGAMLPDLARVALNHSLKGFEGLEGIPGTIGGGIFMNAGAYGSEIKDMLIRIDAVAPDGSTITYSAAEVRLAHRTSIFRTDRPNDVIAKCYFKAEKGDAESIYRKMELYHAKRHRYQDFFYPNLGSIFSGSPYRALGQDDKVFKWISAVYYLFCYQLKPFRRESPINRKWLNDIVAKRFGIKYDVQPFSDKTLNCLVNRGQGTSEMVRFLDEMKLKTKGRIPIENEVVPGF